MQVLRHKDFANGSVYCLMLEDAFLIETTDTFLPFYTKEASAQKSNTLKGLDLGDRSERWMVGVSTMSGCPVGCKFCATGQMKRWRNLTADEIVDQVAFVLRKNSTDTPCSKEFKINYTRMGEPFLNIDNVKSAIKKINEYYGLFPIHHYISTIGLKDSDFSWIKGDISLQISLHSLDEGRRRDLIPINGLMSLEELGQIRTNSNLKTTLNLTLVDERDFDIEKLKKYFDPEYFFIKLSPINPNPVSESNALGLGVVDQLNLI